MLSNTLRRFATLVLLLLIAGDSRPKDEERVVDEEMWLMQIPVVSPQSRANSSSLMQFESPVVNALVPPGTAPVDFAGETMTTLAVAYIFTMAFVGTVIVFIYYPHGTSAVMGILLYVFALSTMKLSVKNIFEHHSLKYPATLIAVHLGLSSLFGFVVIFWRQCRDNIRMPVPTTEDFFFQILPIGVGFALSAAASNMALVVADAGFVEVLTATNPLFSIAFLLLMGMPFDLRLLPPTCAVVAGCMLSAAGSNNFSATGTLLVLTGNAFRAVKVAMQQELLPKGHSSKFDPCSVLAWTCMVSTLFLGIWAAVSDGLAPLEALRHHPSPLAASVAVGISCINAVILNLSMLFVVRSLGAVGTQVVAQTKAALTVFGSVALFNEVVSPLEALGFLAVLGGSYFYARAEKQGKASPESAPEDRAVRNEKTPLCPANAAKT